MDLITMDLSTLEQRPEVWYSKLKKEERPKVEFIQNNLEKFMEDRCNFLIAGVGGILRRHNSLQASDIDIAVVGFTYENKKTAVSLFHNVVERYRSQLEEELASEGHYETRLGSYGYGREQRWVSEPGFANADVTSIYATTMRTRKFFLVSQGIKVKFPYLRPIDVQFTFNQTLQEWKDNQTNLGTFLKQEEGKFSEHFYAILSTISDTFL